MGTEKGFEAKLVLKDTTLTFCKARPVPFLLRPKVGVEIDRLLEAGILSKVDQSEWVTLVVPNIEKDFKGDFKVSENPKLQGDQYPLPYVEDIFTAT